MYASVKAACYPAIVVLLGAVEFISHKFKVAVKSTVQHFAAVMTSKFQSYSTIYIPTVQHDTYRDIWCNTHKTHTVYT